MDAQAHLRFIKNMIAQLQTQADEIEAAIKREFDAAQTPLFPMSPEVVAFHCGDRPIGGSITPALPIGEQRNNTVTYQLSAIADDGWIEFGGNEMPVAGSTRVDVRFADGSTDIDRRADCYSWARNASFPIIAYRIAGERK
jgi:hypothetical protein